MALRGRPHLRRLRAGARRRGAGTSHALATSNCGSALHLGLQVLGAGPGDEVIVADYTFPATGHAVVWTGATPGLRRRPLPTSAPSTRPRSSRSSPSAPSASSPSTWWASPPTTTSCAPLTDRHGLWLLEDAACSAGADYKGRPAGSLADLATFSFHGRKGITSGEGGALVGDDDALMDRARKLHTYGIAPAVSREGLPRWPCRRFDDGGLQLPDVRRPGGHHAGPARAGSPTWSPRAAPPPTGTPSGSPASTASRCRWSSTTAPTRGSPTSSPTADDVDRDAVVMALRERGVGSNFGTYASHVQPVYGTSSDCPVSARLFRTPARPADARQPRRGRPRLGGRPAARGARVGRRAPLRRR